MQQHLQQLERAARAGDPGGGESTDTMRFRAPTLEEAIALAETSLGARVRVVAANRIRRGGIGGFFASDLGVEVTVALDDETMEQALERIVAESAADERVQFESRLAQQLGVRPASLGSSAAATPTAPVPVVPSRPASGIGGRFDQRDDEPTPAVNPVLSEVLAALMAEAVEQQAQQAQQAQQVEQAAAASTRLATEQVRADERERAIAAELATAFAAAARAAEQEIDSRGTDESTAAIHPTATATAASAAPVAAPVAAPTTMIVAPSTVADTARRPVYDTPPTMVRVEQIIEELSAITAEPVFGGDRGRGRVARPVGVERTDTTDPIDPDVTPDVTPDVPPAVADAVAPPVERPKVLPTLPPRPGEIARAASAASAANHTRALASPANLVAPARRVAPSAGPAFAAAAAAAGPAAASPWPARTPQAQVAVRTIPTLPTTPSVAPVAPDVVEPADRPDQHQQAPTHDDDQAEMARMAESVRRALRGDHDPGIVSAIDRDAAANSVHASLEIDADLLQAAPADRDADRGRQITSSRLPGSSSAPSRRQVELAVAATDQLIESLKRDDGVKRLSVRVVLRTGDQREVEAEAEWEAS
jgi:hypothetical protein